MPLSLVGTFGVMYLLGYSLDNLSLMALTISTGFVVDDAIVMIENIDRYHRRGPLAAGGRAARRRTDRLHHRFADGVADRRADSAAVHGRHRGPAVPRICGHAGVTILLSAVISLTLTPMMCSLLLRKRDRRAARHAFTTWSERAFNSTIAFYGRTVKFVLQSSDDHAAGDGCHPGGDHLPLHHRAQGILPGAGYGRDPWAFPTPRRASRLPRWRERQQALAAAILKDKDVESLSSFIGVDGTNTTPNSGRIQINLKPRDERSDDVTTMIKRLQQEVAGVEGITLYMQPVQDLTVEDRVSRTQYQFSLEDADPKELATWTAKLVAKLKTIPELRDVATDQQNQAAQAQPGDRPRHGFAPGNHYQRHRQHAIRRFRAAPGVDHVHPVESVSRGAGGRSAASAPIPIR